MPLYALDEHVPQVADPARLYVAPGAHVIGRIVLGLAVGLGLMVLILRSAANIAITTPRASGAGRG